MNSTELTELAPRTLGHYRLVREAGRGGMSIVYEAVDTRLGRIVALKVLHVPASELIGEGEMVARLEREARAIASLSHPNVVTIYDVGAADGSHYIATEFLDGVTLRERLHQGALTPHEAADVLRQVAEGLDAVHRQGVMHRDIKSSNIMLLYNGRVKLLDFGIARFANDSTLTQIGSMVGSPSYMAPELLTGGKASPASDIWALGVLLFEMLSCRLPFEADSLPRVMYRVAHDDPDSLPNASPEVAAVLRQSLSKSPAERFPTARALADAFAAAAALPFAENHAPEILPESAPAPFVEPAQPVRVLQEDRTVIASTPYVAEARTPAVPTRRHSAFKRRSRLLPAILGFSAIWIVGIATVMSRKPMTQPTQQTVSPVAAHRSGADAKTVPVRPAAPPAKSVFSHTEARTSRPAGVTQRKRILRTARVQKPDPIVAAPRITAAGQAEQKHPIRKISSPVPPVTPDTRATAKSRPAAPETARMEHSQEAQASNPNREEAADERAAGLNRRVRNADLPADETGETQTLLRERLDGWIAATNARDISEQMRYYSPTLSAFYLKRGVPTQVVRAEKARLFARASDVDIRADAPQIRFNSDGSLAIMRFRKQYTIENGARSRRGAVLQELRWKRDGDDWKIVSERDLRVLR